MQSNLIEIDYETLDLLWFSSFRYFLGRATIATHHFCDRLVESWDTIPTRSKVVILRELGKAIADPDPSCLGYKIDADKWKWVFSELTKGGKVNDLL